ncbi:hypothetical protein A3Q56_03358 [Intoshia linei]|uniref:PDZ domain-containing protein n=1 Tax=Intoshia linei TaxID=1819745 RepID=A0A177B3J2_9BILA|nr:hypothetical protein A3Q56_03358 [Intoshia linei]
MKMGKKCSKERITICCTSNMDGTDKQKLMVFGKSKMLRSFKGYDPPVYYTSSKSSLNELENEKKNANNELSPVITKVSSIENVSMEDKNTVQDYSSVKEIKIIQHNELSKITIRYSLSDPLGINFYLRGDQLYVLNIAIGGSVDYDGRLFQNDKILKINNHIIKKDDLDDCYKYMLSNAEEVVFIIVRQNKNFDSFFVGNIVKIDTKETPVLGLFFSQFGNTKQIYVSKKSSNCKLNNVHVGDIVTTINSVDIKNINLWHFFVKISMIKERLELIFNHPTAIP